MNQCEQGHYCPNCDNTFQDPAPLIEALQKIAEWATEAYSPFLFPEVHQQDLRAAHRVLFGAGISLERIHAQWARHLIGGIGRIAKDALAEKGTGGGAV